MDCRETHLIEEGIVELLVRIYLESKDPHLKKFLQDFEHLKALVCWMRMD